MSILFRNCTILLVFQCSFINCKSRRDSISFLFLAQYRNDFFLTYMCRLSYATYLDVMMAETLGDISDVKDTSGGPQVTAQLRRLLLVPVTYKSYIDG